MAEENGDNVLVAARVRRALYEKILKRQREAERLTGTAPSISAIMSVMLEEAPASRGAKAKTKAA